jgi:hypothetical protein
VAEQHLTCPYPPVPCSQSNRLGDRSNESNRLEDESNRLEDRSIVKYVEGEAISGGATSDLSLSTDRSLEGEATSGGATSDLSPIYRHLTCPYPSFVPICPVPIHRLSLFHRGVRLGDRSIVKYVEGEATSGGATSDLSLSTDRSYPPI